MNFEDNKDDSKEKVQDEQDNMYSSYMPKEEDKDAENESNASQEESNVEQETHGFQEKEYKKTNTLEENTTLTKAGAISKFFLFGFYGIVIILGLVAFFMIRANKYEFYLKKESVLVDIGSSYQIELIPKKERYFDYLNYNYSIADESVATVDEFGTVTAVGPGTTTLKISLSPSIFSSKTMKIVTENIDVENVELGIFRDNELRQADSLSLNRNQSVTLGTIVNNRNDLNVTGNYKSSDPNVATVDSLGNVTARSNGTAIITGEINGVEGSVVVTVNNDESGTDITPVPSNDPTPSWDDETPTPKPSSSSGNQTNKPKPTSSSNSNSSSGKVDLGVASQVTKYAGEDLQLTAKVNGKKASSVKWSSSNTKVATVNNKGLIKCESAGTAVITAEVNGVKGTVKVVVKNKASGNSKPTSTGSNDNAPKGKQFGVNNIQLSKTSLTVSKGKTATFTVTVNKSIATFSIKSDNASIASVSVSNALCNSENNSCMLDSYFDNAETGKATVDVTVKGVKAGTTKILVTAEDLIDSNENDITSAAGTAEVGILVK